jgi:hypothetical protein
MAKMIEEPDPNLRQRRKKRPVLIVVEKWPHGTMAFKFGSALMSALGKRRDEATLVQLGPERILRIETDVSEAEFRSALKTKDVSYHGRIHYSGLLTEEPLKSTQSPHTSFADGSPALLELKEELLQRGMPDVEAKAYLLTV